MGSANPRAGIFFAQYNTPRDYYTYVIAGIWAFPYYYGKRGDQINLADVCTAHNTHVKGCGKKNWPQRKSFFCGNAMCITYKG